MSEVPNKETADDEGGFAFLLIFRSVVAIGIMLCCLVAYDEKHEPLSRVGAGALVFAGLFMIYAVGQPGRLYAAAIGIFSALLGGFTTLSCFLDTSCVPREKAWWMTAATITLVSALSALGSYPKPSRVHTLTQAIGIVSATTILYLAWYSRAFGGGILFILIGIGALSGAISRDELPSPARTPGKSSTPPKSGDPIAATAGASAMFWFAYMARDSGGWIVLIFGSVWLIAALSHAWKKQNSRKNAH